MVRQDVPPLQNARGGDRRLVALLVFKTSVGPEEGPGWVRFPFTSAKFS